MGLLGDGPLYSWREWGVKVEAQWRSAIFAPIVVVLVVVLVLVFVLVFP